MMARDIKATRDTLGLTTEGLAHLVGVHPRTAYRWLDGSRPVPEPVWRLLELVNIAVRRGRWTSLFWMTEIGPTAPTAEEREAALRSGFP